MKLRDIADYVTDKISSDAIDLECYVTLFPIRIPTFNNLKDGKRKTIHDL